MEFFGLFQTRGSKRSSSWISFTFLCSMLCMWSSVNCWSYFYSNTTMNWLQARAWCQQHYTDMVAIQNQEEIEHLMNSLPQKPTYYWIGIRKINSVWTWVGTNKALTEEAANWAIGEPNNGKSGQRSGSEDCVEMYIKRTQQEGKWNDERCRKLKTALCYTAACKNDSCLYGDCVETINSHRCACYDGFYGEKCEQVVKCNKDEVTVPYKGSVNCTHEYGNFSYESLCQYSCEEGYELSTPGPLTCTASGQWSEQPPTCEMVQCKKLSPPARGSMTCSSASSYQSTCVFTCDEGYILSGSSSSNLQCEATGHWNDSEPACVAVQCPALQEPENGVVLCGDDVNKKFSYGNTCSFSCDSGYNLVGPGEVTCTSAAEWSERMPRCEAVRCPLLEAPENGRISCSTSEQVYNSQCSFTCDQAHSLEGHDLLICDRNGNWTGEKPTCQAPPSKIAAIASGVATGGTLLSGLSLAMWILKRLKQKANKFELNSNSDIEPPPQVYKNSIDSPIYPVIDWSRLFAITHTAKMEFFGLFQTRGSKRSSSWISFTFLCSMLCMWSSVNCWSYFYSNTTMNWLQARAWCQQHYTDMVAIQNQEEIEHLMNSLPQKPTYYWIGIRKINNVWTWVGTNKALTEEAANWAIGEPNGKSGQRSGSEDCVEMYIKRTQQEGKWNDERCRKLKTALCYTAACKNDSCLYGECVETINSHRCACYDGFYGEKCEQVVTCNKDEVTVPYKGSVNCTHEYGNFSYESLCQYSCEEGYELSTPGPLTCTASGQWSEQPPTCETVRCPLLEAPENGRINCSTSEQVYNSQCSFTCDQAHSLEGHDLLICDRNGNWTGEKPTCQAPPSKIAAIASGVATGGTLLSGLSLAMWILKRLKQKANKFELNSNSDIEPPPQVYKNSIDSPIYPVIDWSRLFAITHTAKMEFFGLFQTRGSKRSSSWISFTFLCSMLCMWSSVNCWSYFYSNTTMNWQQARAWCQQHYTDMVAIQNQEEIEHLMNSLPQKPTYYWIGIRKINNVWTWVGTNKALTEEAANWAIGEPNGKSGQRSGSEDCVEMYIKRTQQEGKWNDERCRKLKTALCYTAACKNDSCLYGDCVETINSHRCACYDGFYGEKCEQVVTCNKDEVTVPYKGSVNCTHEYGNFSYESLCQYSCEEGYELSTPGPLTCTASGQWSEQPPTCEMVQCKKLSPPARGSMTCSSASSYQSTCVFTCDEGYILSGSSSSNLQCEATGHWNDSEPACVAVQCPALQEPENGVVLCGDDVNKKFSYGNTCSFSCDSGYNLVGPGEVTCTSAAEWSERMPRCEAVRCPLLEAPENGRINCSTSEQVYNSQCSFTCDQAHSLEGHDLLICDRNGNWTGEKPTCQAPPSKIAAIASGVATGGTLLSGLSLAMWILKRLKQKANKFELNSNSDIEPPPQVYKNSIDSPI
uniref:P-selectin-like n=1 Tax=Semicossyphus pulcher TaxID=241346 RepID=UPI0037E95A5D